MIVSPITARNARIAKALPSRSVVAGMAIATPKTSVSRQDRASVSSQDVLVAGSKISERPAPKTPSVTPQLRECRSQRRSMSCAGTRVSASVASEDRECRVQDWAREPPQDAERLPCKTGRVSLPKTLQDWLKDHAVSHSRLRVSLPKMSSVASKDR
ncbi:hypothetical protein Nepgr_034001 [Nepenthes gracilis]|uniref:Uncharacterized protein n=1 Tax=Nepenthes gracilis TaxID=150966 RepID=A0AAD3Y732_NEPGR|nr:hypothetical protein Nepgr_034001 [Nepenthes gracilis]